ncbi:MAG: pyruvate, phosphate dikinase, partial [Acidobacteria bacterium]|nr:pyruvate, phosphate dikinase [Acidobacteriota bacterium]
MKKYVYFFGKDNVEGNRGMRDILGGKGANLAEMSGIGVPVPPGFTVSTEACNLYLAEGGRIPDVVREEILTHLAKLEKAAGRTLGDSENPLLVSVRSGSKFSMPGMMDTILNLGLNEKTVKGLAAKSGNRRFALDCYRRLIHMFSDVVLDVPKKEFEKILKSRKDSEGLSNDFELTEEALDAVIRDYKALVQKIAGKDFPQNVTDQLFLAVSA